LRRKNVRDSDNNRCAFCGSSGRVTNNRTVSIYVVTPKEASREPSQGKSLKSGRPPKSKQVADNELNWEPSKEPSWRATKEQASG
jgi:hypothetical protein